MTSLIGIPFLAKTRATIMIHEKTLILPSWEESVPLDFSRVEVLDAPAAGTPAVLHSAALPTSQSSRSSPPSFTLLDEMEDSVTDEDASEASSASPSLA